MKFKKYLIHWRQLRHKEKIKRQGRYRRVRVEDLGPFGE